MYLHVYVVCIYACAVCYVLYICTCDWYMYMYMCHMTHKIKLKPETLNFIDIRTKRRRRDGMRTCGSTA